MTRSASALLVLALAVAPVAPVLCDALCSQPMAESSSSHCTLHETRSGSDLSIDAAAPDCDIVHVATPATKTTSTASKAVAAVSRVLASHATLVIRGQTLQLATHSPPLRTLLWLRI